jgi:hypothetical protein
MAALLDNQQIINISEREGKKKGKNRKKDQRKGKKMKRRIEKRRKAKEFDKKDRSNT